MKPLSLSPSLSLSRSRSRMISIALLSVVLLIPTVSLAYKIIDKDDHKVIECNDGTIHQCWTIGNQEALQVDCVAGEAAVSTCSTHGGFKQIKSPGLEAERIADYRGQLPIDRYTGRKPINSTVAAMLMATCAGGEIFTCVEGVSCPSTSTEIEKRCPSGRASSLAAFLSFTLLSNPPR